MAWLPTKFDKFDLAKIGTGEGRRLMGMDCIWLKRQRLHRNMQMLLVKILIKGKPAFKAKMELWPETSNKQWRCRHLRMNDWDLNKTIKMQKILLLILAIGLQRFIKNYQH